MENLNALAERAKKIIKSVEGNYNNYYVLFSGGKDSLVTLDLVTTYLKDDFKVIYITTQDNTLKLSDDYVTEIVKERYNLNLTILKSEDAFFPLVERYGYPSCIYYNARWCLGRLKNDPIRRFEKLKNAITFSGQKIHDSNNRKKYITTLFENGIKKNKGKFKYWGHITALPIKDYTKQAIWSYIQQNKLPLNPCYNLIKDSGNCVICPFNTYKKMQRVKVNAPEIYAKWIDIHEKIQRGETKEGIYWTYNKFQVFYERLKTQQILKQQ